MRLIYESGRGIRAMVEFDRQIFGRCAWRYTIGDTTGEVFTDASDLETPTYDPIGALRSLATFLGAWAEAWNYSTTRSENWDLFPASMWDLTDWAHVADEMTADLGAEGADQ